jgi:hypothetical protein
MFDIFHVAALIGAFRCDRFFAKKARTRRLARLEDVAKARLGIFRGDTEQSLDGAVIHATALAYQVVILIEDVNGAVHLRGFALNGQPIVMEESGNVKRRLEEFQVLIQSAKKVFDLAGNLYGTSHRVCSQHGLAAGRCGNIPRRFTPQPDFSVAECPDAVKEWVLTFVFTIG